MARKRINPKIEVFENLTTRTYNILAGSDIETIDELAEYYPDGEDEKGILKLRGVGKGTLKELTALLEKHGKKWKKRGK